MVESVQTPVSSRAIPGAETHAYRTFRLSDGERSALHLHVFRPPTPTGTGMVFFHGGGWRNGDPRQFWPQCSFLAARGITGITCEYRLVTKNVGSPYDGVADAKSAIRWVRGHAAMLGIRTDRVAAGGGSAGAHLAACAVMVPGYEAEDDSAGVSCVPDALALCNPVLDVGPGAAGLDGVPVAVRPVEASPLRHVRPGLPPTIVFLGTADKVTPLATAEGFQDAMTRAGNVCRLVTFAGRKHGFFNLEPDRSAVNEAIFGFLVETFGRDLADRAGGV